MLNLARQYFFVFILWLPWVLFLSYAEIYNSIRDICFIAENHAEAVFCWVPKSTAQMIVQQKLKRPGGSGELNIPENQLPVQIK